MSHQKQSKTNKRETKTIYVTGFLQATMCYSLDTNRCNIFLHTHFTRQIKHYTKTTFRNHLDRLAHTACRYDERLQVVEQTRLADTPVRRRPRPGRPYTDPSL